jgi:large subunit ribosomal protein L5
MSYVPRLKTKYREQVVPTLMKQFNYGSVMQAPRLVKISINQGVGAATGDKKLIEAAVNELTTIVGQKAVTTKARKAISNFKLRENMPIGVRVTLRNERMYDFLDRFITIALPRVRDFKGINDKSFDGRGNYTMGITEHIIFPEIDIDKVSRIAGYDISFVTTATTDAEALALLKELGLPFKNQVRAVVEP